jgi:tetratricopeptide (TPR) repeat protein
MPRTQFGQFRPSEGSRTLLHSGERRVCRRLIGSRAAQKGGYWSDPVSCQYSRRTRRRMPRDDWFRNANWDRSIEAAFEERLRRARKKSQYLRIQAGGLADSYPIVALQLLERYFAIGEKVLWAQAYCDQARAFLALGRLDDAITSYEKALEREAEFPNVITQAYIELPFLIAIRHLGERFDRAAQILQDNESRPTFTVERFKWHAAAALIANRRGDNVSASEHASRALAEAKQRHSGFRYHPEIGLVQEHYRTLIDQLTPICGRSICDPSPREEGQNIRSWLRGFVRKFSK